MNELVFTVDNTESLQRLDVFLSGRLQSELSREKLKKLIAAGQVQINAAVCTQPRRQVQTGDIITLVRQDSGKTGISAEDKELRILYKDNDLAVLNKPDGLSVHLSPNEQEGTLVNRLLAHFPEISNMDGDRPGIVHRLDKDTTGLMMVALNEPARLKLAGAFAGRTLHKEYIALVYGVPKPAQGSITGPIGRHPSNRVKMAVLPKGGKDARSDYRILYADPDGRFSLVAVLIHSGRTHQIRVHMTHLGHPIIGDKLYTDRLATEKAMGVNKLLPVQEDFLSSLARHQLLHAWHLEFEHPQKLDAGGNPEEMTFCCAPPEEFFIAAKAFSHRLQRVVLTGNPGCGKSSVLSELRKRGIPVWSADEAVARLYEPGADGWQMLKSRFGDRFIPDSASKAPVNKQALFKAMFDDNALRREVESIIHPMVNADMENFFAALASLPLSTPLAVAEIPLYFESEHIPKHKNNPSVLVAGIHCPFSIRSGRLKTTRNWPDSMIEKMESWQWPEDKKTAAADVVLENTGSLNDLSAEVEKLLTKLENKRNIDLNALEKKLRALVDCN